MQVPEGLGYHQAISAGLRSGLTLPDLIFHLNSDPDQLTPHAIGEVKLDGNWAHALWKSPSYEQRLHFRQVLAQANYYMRQRRCRYAAIITEVEFMAVYRVPGYHGSLKISDPFPIITADAVRNGLNFDMPAM